MSDGLHLAIEVDPILDVLNCPICYRLPKDCVMTKCGHNFCQHCLFVWTSTKATCPCCVQPLAKEQVFRNHQVDSIVSLLLEKKAAAEKKYFEEMIGKAEGSSGDQAGPSNPKDAPKKQSIESIFQSYIKKHVSNAKSIQEDMNSQLKLIESRLQDQRKQAVSEIMASGLSELEKGQRVHAINQGYGDRIKDLSRHFDASLHMLSEHFERSLSQFKPDPLHLPISVTFLIESRPEIRFDTVSIHTGFNSRDLVNSLHEQFLLAGNELDPLSQHNIFVLRSPFDFKETVLPDEQTPIGAMKVMPGHIIVLKGEIKLKSDIPKKCFSLTWAKGEKMTYYQCNSCNLKWICSSCVTSCHSGHNTVQFLQNHEASYACCYCPRRKCCLPNKEKSGNGA
eukprot:TRINITY_DN1465_c0_g2_i10.p1 TRINITY_DN1465_c0_g2~~TRINITY_DN1465_c0_g2_i10.p1  ORF type:complete len:394 (+),score=66.53 TRINITY_DN1465_c0_g2_i10:55-1236(+)